MKWRNQLLALFCLLGFAGLGILYFQHWVVQKPFGIILFVGEGLRPTASRGDSPLCRRGGCATCARFHASHGVADEFLERFCRARSRGRRDRAGHRTQSQQSRAERGSTDAYRPNDLIRAGARPGTRHRPSHQREI